MGVRVSKIVLVDLIKKIMMSMFSFSPSLKYYQTIHIFMSSIEDDSSFTLEIIGDSFNQEI